MEDKKEDLINITDLLNNPNFGKYYVNGFVVGNNLADTFIILQANGMNVAAVNMSVSTAKSMGEALLKFINELEKITKSQFPTIDKFKF